MDRRRYYYEAYCPPGPCTQTSGTPGVPKGLVLTTEITHNGLGQTMTIQYADGRTVQGYILSRSDNSLRAVLSGCDGAVRFTRLHDRWIAEDCEPVQIEFAWQRRSWREMASEADCACSKELASQLIHLLLSGNDWRELVMPGSPEETTQDPTSQSSLFRRKTSSCGLNGFTM
jgi:hypothetical protein